MTRKKSPAYALFVVSMFLFTPCLCCSGVKDSAVYAAFWLVIAVVALLFGIIFDKISILDLLFNFRAMFRDS